jgi:hypothetical protein
MPDKLKIIVGVCEQDDPEDVDAAYGEGTYARLFPPCPRCEERPCVCVECSHCGEFCHTHRCSQCDTVVAEHCVCTKGQYMTWCSANCHAAWEL